MIEILTLEGDPAAAPGAARAAEVLEAGGIVLLPDHAFPIEPGERALLDPAVLAPRSKNVSLNGAGRLGGVRLEGAGRASMAAMVARYAGFADAVLQRLTPDYTPALFRRRTSYRPGAVATRALSPRKDDRRLHVDAFASSPVNGQRILRVFSNVDPAGAPRHWRVGEDDFATFARAFAPRLRGRSAGVRRMMAALGITRGVRSPYDQAMLELHDAAKLDDGWQAQAAYRAIDFPVGSSWIVYTDAVLHAALGGQHAFEQTYLMAPEAMRRPEHAPLRVLEAVLERALT